MLSKAKVPYQICLNRRQPGLFPVAGRKAGLTEVSLLVQGIKKPRGMGAPVASYPLRSIMQIQENRP